MEFLLDTAKIEDYRTFLKAKVVPQFSCRGNMIYVPDEYAHLVVGKSPPLPLKVAYEPSRKLFDYQEDISALAIRKQKFGVFARPGLGKTFIMTEYAKHVLRVLPPDKKILMLSPQMVVRQTLSESKLFYGADFPLEQIPSGKVSQWLASGEGRFGITNFEALNKEPDRGHLGCLIVDEMLKDSCGKWIQQIFRLGRGLDWKLVSTGTPAPNDRIEYATHAVFLDVCPTINSFMARYFVNKGKTGERWIIKPHAVDAFYRDMSHWCIFVNNPGTYGWKDNCNTIPPIHVHIHDLEMSEGQSKAVFDLTGRLFLDKAGGISERAKLSQIGHGKYKGKDVATPKWDAIKTLLASWPDESTIIWAWYNDEQDYLEKLLPEAASIAGKTKYERREELLEDFKQGRRKDLISKSQVLGFGLNLQKATRMIFSSMRDSYERFHQCIMRANRVGSTRPLNVHIPVTEVERPGMESVLRKAARVDEDNNIQEQLFRDNLLEYDFVSKKAVKHAS